MANVFVTLPVPAGDGVGAWVDTSSMAAGKTISVDGGDFTGKLFIESSNDGQTSAGPVDCPTFTGGTTAAVDILAATQWMRVRRSGALTPFGAPTVKVGAPAAIGNVFAGITVPTGDGAGVGADLSAGGDVNTFNVVGPFSGQVFVDISTDAGVSWSPAFLVGVPGQTTNGSAVGTNYLGVIGQARVRRAGVLSGVPDPVVSVGSSTVAGAGGGAAGTWQGTEGLTPTVATGGAVVAGQRVVAQWTVGITRVYAIDGVNGNDAFAGFADPATSSAADYATASAAAGLVAKRTFAGLAAIFPRYGAGRTFEIQILGAVAGAGTVYAGGLDTFLAGLDGYALNSTVRGTGTSATSGTTAFDGSAADCSFAGFATATGMNGPGYNPVGAPTTSVIQCLRVGGAAPAFAAEPALPDGARMRFDVATATAALRNVSRGIVRMTGTDTLAVATAFPAVPAAGDVFYIEEGGVVASATSLITDPGGGSLSFAVNLVGIKLTGALTVRGGAWNLAGVRATSMSAALTKSFTTSTTYTHPVRGSITQGMFGRSDGAVTLTNCRQFLDGLVCAGLLTNTLAANTQALAAFTVGLGYTINGTTPQFGVGIGNSALNAVRARIIGPAAEAGLSLNNANVTIAQLDITNMGAKPAIKLEGTSVLSLAGGIAATAPSIGGSTGNTDVGLDLTLARNSLVIIDSAVAPTVTGTAGDVRGSIGTGTAFAGGVILTWAQIIAAGGFTDAAGNRIILNALAGGVNQQSTVEKSILGLFTGELTTSSLLSTTSFLANPGLIVGAINQLIAFHWPVSLRLVTALRVCALGGTVAGFTVTLFRNGIASVPALVVTVPPATAAGAKFLATAAVLFADGDDFDLQIAAGPTEEGSIEVSAVLEGPE